MFLRSYCSKPRPAVLKLPTIHPTLLPLVLSSSNLEVSRGPWHTPHPRHRVATRTKDNSYTDEETVLPFFLSRPHSPQCRPIGFLRPEVVSALEADHGHQISAHKISPWNLQYSDHSEKPWSASFSSWVNEIGYRARTAHIDRLVREWKRERLFHDILRGWSEETYPVYHHAINALPSSGDSVAFSIERASLPLFGFANFGCLLIASFRCRETDKTMLWVPRRSRRKKTWPGRLDVTVGGGIGLGETAMSTIVRECTEEASLDPDYVREHVRAAGVLPFPNRSPEGWILPGLYYLYDLPLPSNGSIRPKTNAQDGEVESFELMDMQTVLHNLLDGAFKASSGLAVLDFMIRRGHVTQDSDPRFADVCLALRRGMVWPLPRW